MVDDDEIWIGSAINGNAASTFPGLIDEVAIHRGTVPAEEIRGGWNVDESVPFDGGTAIAQLPEDSVLYEIFEGMPDGSWHGGGSPGESFTRPHFALVELPLRYGEAGVREDRSNPCLVRASGRRDRSGSRSAPAAGPACFSMASGSPRSRFPRIPPMATKNSTCLTARARPGSVPCRTVISRPWWTSSATVGGTSCGWIFSSAGTTAGRRREVFR